MNTNEDVIEIDLQELFGMLLSRLWLIILCGVVCAVGAYVINKVTVTPLYQSTTSVYVMSKDDSSSVTLSDVQLSSQMTQDYAQIITSRSVLEGVIESLGLEDNYSDFSKRVSVTNPTGTRILKITVTDESPFMAQTLANEVRMQAAAKIKAVMDIQAINTVDEANFSDVPSNSSAFKSFMLGGVLGAFVCIAILVIMFMLDDTVKTAEDVERYLHLSTLASIPIREEEDAKKGRGKAHRAPDVVEESSDDDDDEDEEEPAKATGKEAK